MINIQKSYLDYGPSISSQQRLWIRCARAAYGILPDGESLRRFNDGQKTPKDLNNEQAERHEMLLKTAYT